MIIRRLYHFFALLLVCALTRIPLLAQAPALTRIPLDSQAPARPAYFIDGYHGGIYGHIPPWQTKFMVDKLDQYPDWKINLELEPESWDTIAVKDPEAYEAFKTRIADQSTQGRIEYINPAYGQSYLYNISGESTIRQLYYGMRKLRQHFPGIVFSTYSSEEPCFTSALPQILRSYGLTYASLKNPNTCWGGYTRAFGGELVNWIGPDGTSVLTVPRYGAEALKPHSTWETIASNNSIAYILRCFQAGISHPVGMCLQDAGWANGPWIKRGEDYGPGTGAPHGAVTDDAMNDVTHSYHPTVYETWRGYFENHTDRKAQQDWHFSQEDVLVSLVWGGQILQQVAREVRAGENKIVAAEKLASMAALYKAMPWPGMSFDEAWRTLLLSQHHDCWIVPYNRLRGSVYTWAENVDQWIANTTRRSDSIAQQSMTLLTSATGTASASAPEETAGITVFNTLATERDECVEVELPAGWAGAAITDKDNRPVPGQRTNTKKWLFRAHVPSLGYAVYDLRQSPAAAVPRTLSRADHQPTAAGTPVVARAQGARATLENNGACHIETDLYSVTIDPAKGGIITRLATKGRNPKVFTDAKALHHLNELRGNFYLEGGFHSSTEIPAQLDILENGPLRILVQIRGEIAGTPFAQLFTLDQGEPRIDIHWQINWTADHKIGESPDSIKSYPLKKEFYNDSFKLQALFPVALRGQKIYKNAPFDVLKSRLPDTFFDSWDSIKNVVVLNWVDVTDKDDHYGLAVFSDETTSYAHGPNYPLALTVQYSGPGLFGRDYSITGPTTMDYAILPHTGRWDRAGIWTAATRFNEPLLVKVGAADAAQAAEESPSPHAQAQSSQNANSGSLLHLSNSGWEVPAITASGTDLLVRLFNAEGKDSLQRIYPGFPVNTVYEVALDGHIIQPLHIKQDARGKIYIPITAPRFGIRTIQFKDIIK
jgi:alpha-mannosidase